jgi:hypothetical protein
LARRPLGSTTGVGLTEGRKDAVKWKLLAKMFAGETNTCNPAVHCTRESALRLGARACVRLGRRPIARMPILSALFCVCPPPTRTGWVFTLIVSAIISGALFAWGTYAPNLNSASAQNQLAVSMARGMEEVRWRPGAAATGAAWEAAGRQGFGSCERPHALTPNPGDQHPNL